MHKPLIDPISGEQIDEPVVLYHAPCPDGFCAALAAWMHFGGRGQYIGISHEQRVPDVTGRPVYMLDIAFKRNVMERVESQASRLVVLDHHLGAAQGLEGFSCRCGLVHFDMTNLGAQAPRFSHGVSAAAARKTCHVQSRTIHCECVQSFPIQMHRLIS